MALGAYKWRKSKSGRRALSTVVPMNYLGGADGEEKATEADEENEKSAARKAALAAGVSLQEFEEQWKSANPTPAAKSDPKTAWPMSSRARLDAAKDRAAALEEDSRTDTLDSVEEFSRPPAAAAVDEVGESPTERKRRKKHEIALKRQQSRAAHEMSLLEDEEARFSHMASARGEHEDDIRRETAAALQADVEAEKVAHERKYEQEKAAAAARLQKQRQGKKKEVESPSAATTEQDGWGPDSGINDMSADEYREYAKEKDKGMVSEYL
jgi:hypothetical protein